jgi:hypothetical protein
MEAIVYSLLLTLLGGYALCRNCCHFRDEAKLHEYLLTSPKARLWVNKLGLERTALLSKKIFLPLGSLVAVGMLALGLVGLVTML